MRTRRLGRSRNLGVGAVAAVILFGATRTLGAEAIRDQIPHGLKTPEQALTDIDNEINAGLEEIGFFS